MDAGHQMGARQVVAYYYASLVYSNFGEQEQLKKTYEEGVMGEALRQLFDRAYPIPDSNVYGWVIERSSWKFRAPYRCMRYINDFRYRSDQITTKIWRNRIQDRLLYHSHRCSDLSLKPLRAGGSWHHSNQSSGYHR